MIREFTVIKPKMEKVLVIDPKLKDGDQFKDTPINISDDVLYNQIISSIHVLSSSWTENNEIKIVTDSSVLKIKKCIKKYKLKITTNRPDLKNSHLDQNGKTVSDNNQEFSLSARKGTS